MSKSRISLRTPSCRITINLIVSRCPSQAKALSVLTAVAPPAVNPTFGHPAPIQGLNLNRRSTAGPKTEMPVTGWNYISNIVQMNLQLLHLNLTVWVVLNRLSALSLKLLVPRCVRASLLSAHYSVTKWALQSPCRVLLVHCCAILISVRLKRQHAFHHKERGEMKTK
jgi:hypothetical protein